MFARSFIRRAINRSAENDVDRRRFMAVAGSAGLVAGSACLFSGTALAGGRVLPARRTRRGTRPGVGGRKRRRREGDRGRRVTFGSKVVRQYAQEIATDELAHVNFLRGALGSAAVARPAIDLDAAFAAAAKAAGLGTDFDAYADEHNFLLAAYIFEDLGVTTYKGAAPLIDNKTFLEAAAGILAVEAYHASNIRTTLAARGLDTPALFGASNALSDARDGLDGPADKDQGLGWPESINIVPADENAIAFGRSPGDVLNVVYLTRERVRQGGFFPWGVNGELNTSSALS